MKKLTKEEYRRIILEPKNSVIKQYKKELELDGVELSFTEEAIELIAEEVTKEGRGARGIDGIMENIMRDHKYEASSKDKSKNKRPVGDMFKEDKLVIDKKDVEKIL